MKRAMLVAALAAATMTGCVAVPVYDSGAGYGYDYTPGYYYAPPAASFSFGYVYRDGGRRHHRGDRHYRGRRGHRH